VLSLALVAVTHPAASYLRQGCTLVLDATKKRELSLVFPDGRRDPAEVQHSHALEYAQSAAKAFGLDPFRKLDGPDREVPFDKELAKADLAGEKAEGEKTTETRGRGRGKKP
jgi:hypothetical protein